jgi:histidine triad (HIT) family protein
MGRARPKGADRPPARVMDCLFCKIRDRKVPAKIVFEDSQCLAIEDLRPQAPTHLLLIPRKHLATTLDIAAEDEVLVGHLHRVAAHLARERGIADHGFRTVLNCNPGAGQSIYHLHLHLLGGRAMRWPPG